MTSERKYRKGLTKDHWMCKIQRYAFGIEPTEFYSGYCPFFWMTWLAIICAPFILGWTFLVWLLNLGWDQLSDHLAKGQEPSAAKPPKKEKPVKPKEPDLWFWREVQEWLTEYSCSPETAVSYSADGKNKPRYMAWFELNPHTDDQIREMAKVKTEEYRKMRDEREAKQALTRKAKEERDEKLRHLACRASVFGRFIARLIVIPVILFFLWLVFKAATHVATNWTDYLLGAALACGVFGLCFGCICLAKKLAAFIEDQDVKDRAANVAEKVSGPLLATLSGIAWAWTSFWGLINEGLSFLGATIKMTYKAECPMIVWGDETTGIEKNSTDQPEPNT